MSYEGLKRKEKVVKLNTSAELHQIRAQLLLKGHSELFAKHLGRLVWRKSHLRYVERKKMTGLKSQLNVHAGLWKRGADNLVENVEHALGSLAYDRKLGSQDLGAVLLRRQRCCGRKLLLFQLCCTLHVTTYAMFYFPSLSAFHISADKFWRDV